VVVAGFLQEPLRLLTNPVAGVRNSELPGWIVEIHLTRWKIEKTFRILSLDK
jgi:hypothetical protein